MNILLELMELRYDSTSTIVCTPLPPNNWPTVLRSVALGQAILGRIPVASSPIYQDVPDYSNVLSTKSKSLAGFTPSGGRVCSGRMLGSIVGVIYREF